MKNKYAKVLDDFRVIPRLMVLMYGVLFYQTAHWFMTVVEPTGSQATFISVIVGAAGVMFGFYVNSGSNND